MVGALQQLSGQLRNAADVCDNFIRSVHANNPVAIARAIGQPSNPNARNNDFNNFLQGSGNFLPGVTGGNAAGATQPHQQQTAQAIQQAVSMPQLGPDDVDANGKKLSKRQKKLLRKARDPDAPKRPPSAYLLFQNEVRSDMRTRFPEMPYKEVLGKVSEAWKNLSDEERKVYQDKTNEEMKRWTVEKRDHEQTLPFDQSTSASEDFATPHPVGVGNSLMASGVPAASSPAQTPGRGQGSSLAPAMGNTTTAASPEAPSKKRKDANGSKKDKRSRH